MHASLQKGRAGSRRTWFVGDVHGCADELDQLLHRIDFQPQRDELVFLGDLVGKGPAAAEVLQRALGLDARGVLGNHDARLLERSEAELHRMGYGSRAIGWLRSLPHIAQFDTLGLIAVHAALDPCVALESQDPRVTLHGRSLLETGRLSSSSQGAPWVTAWHGPARVLFGHDARRGLQCFDFGIGLDTGCVYGGALSAWCAEENRLVQVDACKPYCAIPQRGRATQQP